MSSAVAFFYINQRGIQPMSNSSKGIIAFVAFILAFLIVAICQVYQEAHATAPLETCKGKDPRITSPYPLSACDEPLTLWACIIKSTMLNANARKNYTKHCTTQSHPEKALINQQGSQD
jgi:hypothetical protein